MHRRRRVFLVRPLAVAILWMLGGTPAQARAQDMFPETAATAMRLHEEETELAKWLEGPVEYIVLGEERQIWDDIDNDEERRQFIAWFWGRRDNDPRDEENVGRQAFYERVAEANRRFSGFPRGWRSDRGRVWITMGRPTGGMRRTELSNYGRCSAQSGEWWTYDTNNMAFQASFGEFHVIFVETRVGQYEVCDPSMLGPGAYPVNLRRALEISAEALVLDPVTEFAPGRGTRPGGAVTVREATGTASPLEVPFEEWSDAAVADMVVIPVELPLRDLLFEPEGDRLKASIHIEANLVALGDNESRSGTHVWTLDLGPDEANGIGGSSLRTAIVLPADPGGYSVQIRVLDPLSGNSWVWDGPVEVSSAGAAVSPMLVGTTLVQLRDAGEIAVLAPDVTTISPGSDFAAIVWARGVAPDSEAIELVLESASGEQTPIEGSQVAWGNQAAAGPLVVQATMPALAPGNYVLRLTLGDGIDAVERVIRVR